MDALFDTGATRSFVDVGVAEKLVYSGFEKPKEVLLAAKDGKACVIGELTARVTVEGVRAPPKQRLRGYRWAKVPYSRYGCYGIL